MTTNTYEIHERVYRFVILVLKAIRKVKADYYNSPLINQLVRSVTSVGANDREADGSLTKADFVHKYSLVRKELKESVYWLQVIRDTNIGLDDYEKLIGEGDELIKIVSAIMNKSRGI